MATFGEIAGEAAAVLRMERSYERDRKRWLISLRDLEQELWRDFSSKENNIIAWKQIVPPTDKVPLAGGWKIYQYDDNPPDAPDPDQNMILAVQADSLSGGGARPGNAGMIASEYWRTLTQGFPPSHDNTLPEYPFFYEIRSGSIWLNPPAGYSTFIRIEYIATATMGIGAGENVLAAHESSVSDELLYFGLVRQMANSHGDKDVAAEYHAKFEMRKEQENMDSHTRSANAPGADSDEAETARRVSRIYATNRL